MVINSPDNDERWLCANIEFGVPTTVAHVDLAGAGVSGSITFEQATEFVDSPTTVLVRNLKYEVEHESITYHNWHVHTDPIDDANNCSAAGGPHNPTNVEYAQCVQDALDGDDYYDDDYYAADPDDCEKEVGDLTAKLGMLSIPTELKTGGVVDVPLNGEYSILGRSVVVHDVDTNTSICGTVGWELTAKATFGVYGSIVFTQAHGSDSTTIEIDLTDLPVGEGDSLNYHVHESPVPAGFVGETTEGCALTKGHFDPLG